MTQSADPSLVLLIPAYNEEERIGPVLRRYGAYFQKHYHGRYEIVVVLNGCRDNTLRVVEEAAAEFPEIRPLEYVNPIGKGGALIEGLKLAETVDLIGYVDADGATPPEAFLDLVRHCDDVDCAIGSRWLPESQVEEVQSLKRRIFSRCFHIYVELLFWMGIKDTQCGAKVMRREAVKAVHERLCIADVAFDINLLYSIKRAGFTIREVPTVWRDQIGSKIKLNKGSIGILLSVLRLRLVYSPFYRWLRPLRPLEGWIYKKLRAPQPLAGPVLLRSKKDRERERDQRVRQQEKVAKS